MGQHLSTVGAVCFFEWATIHVLAFAMMAPAGLRNDIGNYYVPGLTELAPQKDQDDILKAKYPKWIGRPLFQHAFNLGWAGCFSYLCAYAIKQKDVNPALPLISLVPWLADVGYFMAIDLPELGGPVAQAQTYIISTACICGALVAAEHHGTDPTLQVAGFSSLMVAAVVNKLTWKLGWRKRNPQGLF